MKRDPHEAALEELGALIGLEVRAAAARGWSLELVDGRRLDLPRRLEHLGRALGALRGRPFSRTRCGRVRALLDEVAGLRPPAPERREIT